MIHARCPGCQAPLSIPAEWLQQAIRCKRCGMQIQAKTPAMAVAAPVAKAAGGVPMGLVPSAAAMNRLRAMPPLSIRLGHGAGTVLKPPLRRRRRRRAAPLVGWALTLGLLGAGGYVGWPHLVKMLEEANDQEPAEPPPVVQVKRNDTPAKTTETRVENKAFPRRLLAIQVSNYLYFNPVSYGPRLRNGHTLVNKLARTLEVAPNQVFELSDAAPTPPGPRPPLRDLISKAIQDFAATSRGQDRIIVLFSGHAVDIDGVPYLVPLDGEPGSKETLVPLSEVFAQLAGCKARQKILLLDICRFDPARGAERPNGGPMTEAFEAALAKPPAGVQVWTACSAGQHSYEDALVSGSIFVNALIDGLTPGSARGRRLDLPKQQKTSPLPLAEIQARVGRWATEDADTYLRRQQTPKLYGSEIEGGAPFDPYETPAASIAIPKLEGDFFAPKELVQGIIREIGTIPPVRTATEPVGSDNLPPFRNQLLRDYRQTESGLRTPIQTAIAQLDKQRASFREEFPIRNIAQLKTEVLLDQRTLAQTKLALEDALEALERAAEERQKEMSPRWRAVFDLVRARLLMRLAFIFEYQYMLSEVRTESLPELGPKHIGWRLASRARMQAKGEPGKEARERGSRAREILEAVARDHRGTPYEILAKRELATALGLEWQPLSPAGTGE